MDTDTPSPAAAPDSALPLDGRAPSPAESAIAAAGLSVTPREMPQLERLVARRLPAPPEAVAAALCEVRRKGWAARMNDMANRAGRAWVRPTDARAASAAIGDPEAGDGALEAALDDAVAARLRAAGPSPEAALDAVAADLADAAVTLNAERHAQLAAEVAAAFGLRGAEAARFLDQAEAAETARRRERRQAEAAARERRREEAQRLRDWERSLVDFRALPEMLGGTQKEVLRWIAAGLIPVARRLPGKGGERWEFDPEAVRPLRAEVAEWRAREQEALEQAQPPRRRDARDPSRPAAPSVFGRRVGNAAIARVAALDRYAAHFATARALDRRITLVTGPTNSGKSHTALDRLGGAESGMALAPLRLLAHEFREALGERGVPASLVTGEERIPVPGSRHVAATVEMCQFRNPVDVALVDEAQMLFDRDRGAAWTAAIMGAPAREVFVLGAPDCVPMIRRIAALCGDPVDEIRLERKSPLSVASRTVRFADLRKGDALIAFSRREVLDYREELLRQGRRVAVLYGALSPEVRRAEAARFRTGEADILVSTDVIGMGLNIPVARIVLSTLTKFDGISRRTLTAQEVKQIGGRAGRFGLHEHGIVALLEGAGQPEVLRRLMEAPPEAPEDLRPLVQPDADIVKAVSAEISSDSLFGVLSRIRRAVLRTDDPNYRLADLDPQIEVAVAVDGVGLGLLDRWTYALCPVDTRDYGVARLARWAVEHAAGRQVAPPVAGRLPAPERAGQEELERAEKVQRRLVGWRWMHQRFPDAYAAAEAAEAERARLDSFIEGVLRHQRQSRNQPRAAAVPKHRPAQAARPGRARGRGVPPRRQAAGPGQP